MVRTEAKENSYNFMSKLLKHKNKFSNTLGDIKYKPFFNMLIFLSIE